MDRPFFDHIPQCWRSNDDLRRAMYFKFKKFLFYEPAIRDLIQEHQCKVLEVDIMTCTLAARLFASREFLRRYEK